MTLTRHATAALVALAAAGGGALAVASVAEATPGADRSETAASQAGGARATADDAPLQARGSVVFRTERYVLSERAVVTTSPTTIRITDDAAINEKGVRTGLYIQFGYTRVADKPESILVNTGVAIRGYDFATGGYDRSQEVKISTSGLKLNAPYGPDATHAWGRLNSDTERGVDLDIHGVHFDFPS